MKQLRKRVSPDLKWLGVLFIVAALLRIGVASLYPMGAEFDMKSYRIVGEAVLSGQNIYETAPLRYPYFPGWMLFEAAAVVVTEQTQLPFWFVIRLPQIAADIALCGVIYYALQHDLSESVGISPLEGAAFHALNPVAIMIIGGHGQFDSLPILGLVAAIALFYQSRRDLSAIMLGLGIVLKPIPAFMGLLFLARCPDTASRLRYFSIAALPTALLSIPFLIWDPVAFIQGTLGYNSDPLLGWFSVVYHVVEGLTRLGFLSINLPNEIILSIGARVVIVATLAISMWFYHDPYKQTISIWRASLLIILLFYVVSAGVAPQYAFWVLPFLVLVSVPRWFRFSFLAAAFFGPLTWYMKTYAVADVYVFTNSKVIFGVPVDPILIGLYLVAVGVFWLVSSAGLVSVIQSIRHPAN